MLLEKRQYKNGTIVGVWQITESVTELLRLLNDPTFEMEIKLSSEKRKREKLAVRLLLKNILGKPVKIVYDGNGAPLLADDLYRISISHSKNFAAVSIHPTRRVGVDIEQITRKIESLKHKFLSENELRDIDINRPLEYLFVCWCAKETLFKLIPENEIHFVGQLHIAPFLLQKRGILVAHETRTQRQEHFALHYEIEKDFVMVFGTGN